MGTDIHVYVETLGNHKRWGLVPGQHRICYTCLGTSVDPIRICGNCKHTLEEHEPGTNKCWFDSTAYQECLVPCRDKCAQGSVLLHNLYRLDRNYYLFGLLSGVRGKDIVPSVTKIQRGLPADVSPLIRHYSDSLDYHNHGWYTLTELRRFPCYEAGYPEADVYAIYEDFPRLLSKLSDVAPLKDPDRVRMVFWYDN